MKKILVFALVLGTLLACNNNVQSEEVSEVSKDVIVPLYRILNTSEQSEIVIYSDQSIYNNNEHIGSIDDNATLYDNSGALVLRIDEGGWVYNSAGEAQVQIDPNGIIDNGSGLIYSWSNEGEFQGDGQNVGFKLTPFDKANPRNASLIIFAYLSF